MYEVILSPEAEAFYASADGPLTKNLLRCYAQLEHDPRRHNNIKRLSGRQFAGHYRYRVGDWRLIYTIAEPAKQVHVLIIAHRSEVYD